MDNEQLRKYAIPKQADIIITSYYNYFKVAGHPNYEAAKAGDVVAAGRLVLDLIKPETVDMVNKQVGEGAIFSAPYAIEKTGHNKIPNAIAEYYAIQINGIVDLSIVQSSKAYHTGAGAMERLISRVTFNGDIEKGGNYVLVDDVTTMGGTLAELNNYIQQGGGKVGGIVTVSNASRAHILIPQKTVIREIERRYGNEIREIFKIDPKALTTAEAGYLIRFRDAESLRNRAIKAREEIRSRLLSKGICTPEKEVDSAPALTTSEKNYKALMLARGIEVKFPGKQRVEGIYMGQKDLTGRLYSIIDSPLNTPNQCSYMIPFAAEHKDLMRFRAVQFDGKKIQYSSVKTLVKNLGGKELGR